MSPTADPRREAYRALVEAVVGMGYPEPFGRAIADSLGTEKMMVRMTAYLRQARPGSAEEIADEMLAILSDRDRWVRKKQAEYYNSRYNRLLWEGLE